MQVRLAAYWDRLSSTYWFVPTVMSLASIGLFLVTIPLDRRFADRLAEAGWLLSSRPEGARDLLTTAAASLITVGGVAFSVTIGAVVYSAIQFGPRLLTNFMKDRGNQFALGTFIATFLFSILVLLTIRGSEEADSRVFVPHIAVTCDLVLVLFSLGVLIYFFHHVPESIHVFNLLAHIGGQFNRTVCELFPERVGHEGSDGRIDRSSEVRLPAGFEEDARLVRVRADGYVQAIDDEGLFDIACKHDLIIKLVHRPGDFVNKGRVVILAWPGDRVDDELARRMTDSYVVGTQRTDYQDALFLIKELVEFAARALSAGQNDPYTAISCINWLGSNLVALAGRVTPDARRVDDRNQLRLVAEPLGFDQLADTVFDQLRPYVKNDANTAAHMMDMIRWVAPQLRLNVHRKHLLTHATALKRSCEAQLQHDRNLTILNDIYKDAVSILTHGDEAFVDPEPQSISRAARQQG